MGLPDVSLTAQGAAARRSFQPNTCPRRRIAALRLVNWLLPKQAPEIVATAKPRASR